MTEAVTEAHADAASAAAAAGRGAGAAAWAGVVDAGGAPGAGGGAGRLGGAYEATVEPARAEALTARLHSLELAAAAASLLAAEAGARDASLRAPPRGLRAEAVAAALAPLRVRLVPRLRTRLLLLPACEDVTAEGEAEGAPWFLDAPTSTVLLLARPPAGLSHELCLHQAICALLGASAGPSLAPLLAPAAAPPPLLLPHLRVQPPRAWAAAAIAGAPGARVDVADEALLQLKPVRPFFAGEVVAVQAEGGGYRYAAVDAARLADAPADEARRLVALRAPELAHVSPLAVFSFATQVNPTPSPTPSPSRLEEGEGA